MRSRAIRRKWASAITSIFTLAFLVGVTGPAAALVPTIVLAPATDTNAVGTEHTVTATVEDEGTPIEGASVHFDVDATGAPDPTSGDDVTDASGEATFTFTNTEAVTNIITACIEIVVNQTCGVGETSTTATKTWEDPAPTTISLAPATDTNPVDTDHTVTATVEDQFGEPFEGADVHFDVDAVGAPVPTSGDDVTDAAGEATFTFTNTEAATNSITACIDADSNQVCDVGETADTAEKVWEVRTPITIDVAPEDAINVPGTDHTVTATVLDQFDDPVAGEQVRIAVTGTGSPSPTALTANTDVNGEVDFTFSNPVEAVNTITACFGPVETETCDTATKSWEEPAPTIIELTPATDTNPVDTDHTVTATVLDQFGDPSEGVDVHFDVTGDGAPAPTTGDDVTDAAGEATFTFTNTEAATNSITACIDADSNQVCDVGETADTAEKVWEARVATAISLDPATATNEVDTDHTVTATVVDQVGDPVQGVAVLFNVSAEGTPAPTTGSDVTDVNGEGTFTFTNSTAGVTNTVTACMDTAPQNAVCDVGEETDTATKAWEAEEPPETCPGFEADPRNQIVGTPGDDVLEGTPGDDIICGLGGDDTMAGLGGDDLILGGPGDDTASGGAGEDVLIGGGGADTLVGGPDDDVLRGNAGRDILRGGGGSDLLIGGGNRDILQGGGDDDILRGNAGNDVLRGGGGDDNLRGGGGRDAIRGGSGDDTLRGGGGNDDLRAGGGDDRVFGGSGDDVLRGGAGNDLLNGGAGTDSCAGGPGSDVLVNCES